MLNLLLALAMPFGTISTNNVPSTSLVVTAPSGIANGDILIAFSTSDSATSTPGFPAGYTQPSGSPQTLSVFDANRFAVALKIAASESGNYTLTSTGNSAIGGVLRVTGREQSVTPHRVAASKRDIGDTTALTTGAFSSNTTQICDIIVVAINDGAGADLTFTQPAGYTKDADISEGSPFARQFMIAHLDSVASGFDGVLSLTSSGTVAKAAYVIALAPGVGAAVTGTATASITEADVVAGGKTEIKTLTGDSWITV